MRVRSRAQADLAPLALGDRPLVLVEDLDLPAGHRPAHGPLAHLHEREVRAQRVGLREPVVVEHGDPVLLAKPADRLRVERLAGRADDPELLRVALAGLGDRHHRPHRGRGREHVRDLVAREEVELVGRDEAGLALQHVLDRAQPPGAEQGGDPRGPGPLAHAVKALAVLDVVAVDELLVGQDVAVGVDDALRHARGPRRVVELRRVVGGRVLANVVGRVAGQQLGVQDEQLVDERGVEAAGVGLVGDQHLRGRVFEAMTDPFIAVEHGHRQQDRAELPGAEEHRRGLGRGREDHRDPVAPADPVRAQQVRRLVGEVLELAPVELAGRSVVALPHHRRLVARVLVAAVGGDVVALRHVPLVLRARLLVRLDHVRQPTPARFSATTRLWRNW